MRMRDIGPNVFAQGVAVSSLSYTPPFDRETLIQRLLITSPSASDTWTVNIGGREVMRFLVNTTGNNQLTGIFPATAPYGRDLFTWYRTAMGEYPALPVPNGLTVTVSSVGGATANITLMGADYMRGALTASMVNHYLGNRFIIPQYGFVNAAVTAAGEVPFDSVVTPAWVGSIFTGVPFRVGWQARILALFIEAASVNTFSGAANHVSSTDHIGIVKNGERMFSHVLSGAVSGAQSGVTTVPAGNFVAPEGLPNTSVAAAAGSANTVYSRGSNPFPAFQVQSSPDQNFLDEPLLVRGGDNFQFYLGITGDVTGGAAYASATVCALLEVMQVAG